MDKETEEWCRKLFKDTKKDISAWFKEKMIEESKKNLDIKYLIRELDLKKEEFEKIKKDIEDLNERIKIAHDKEFVEEIVPEQKAIHEEIATKKVNKAKLIEVTPLIRERYSHFEITNDEEILKLEKEYTHLKSIRSNKVVNGFRVWLETKGYRRKEDPNIFLGSLTDLKEEVVAK